MIKHLSIRNYQSLHVVDLDLDPFTVVIGPSSSGKSALVRALKLLTSNARGHSYVSSWAKRCKVSATTDKGTVSISRAERADDNYYELNGKKFTKLGGEVPEEVTDFLGLLPKDDLNFAGQFDPPYLLTEAPSGVAKSLGTLTNVELVFEAAREAKKERLSSSSMLKTRTKDLSEVTSSLNTFTHLKRQGPAIKQAEASLKKASEYKKQLEIISGALSRIQEAQETADEKQKKLRNTVPSIEPVEELLRQRAELLDILHKLKEAKTTSRPVAEVPSVTHVQELAAQWKSLRSILLSLQKASGDKKEAEQRKSESTQQIAQLEELFHQALEEAGQCPLCGAVTSSRRP